MKSIRRLICKIIGHKDYPTGELNFIEEDNFRQLKCARCCRLVWEHDHYEWTEIMRKW